MGERNPDVDAWFGAYDIPMKEAVQHTREILLVADSRIGETIKWSTPTVERARPGFEAVVRAWCDSRGDA